MTARRRTRKGRVGEAGAPAPPPLPVREPTRLHTIAALLLAAGATVLAAWLAQALFSGLPRVGDEVSYAFQGRIFAAGRLYLPPPPVPEAFDVDNVILTADRWCSKYPPGFPLLLAPGWLLGVPWLVNPLLLGAAVFGLFRLGSRLFGPATGLLGAFLLATLPFALLQAAGFMSHVASLALVTWCLSLLADGDSGRSRPRLVTAGLLGGLAFLVRPASSVFLLGVPVLLLLGLAFPRGRRLRAATLLVSGGLLPVALLLGVQWLSFGSPFRSGYAVFDPWETFLGNRQGFRPLAEILRHNVAWYATFLPRALWEFPGPPFLWLLFVLAKPRREDLVVASSAAGLLAGYLGYFYADVIHGGPRFAFEATGPLALLAARGLGNAGEILESAARRAGLRLARLPVAAATGGACLLAAATVSRDVPNVVAHARHYRGVPNDPMAGAEPAGVGPDALVLVDFEDPRRSLEHTGADSPVYLGYFLRNALAPSSGRRVYARALPGRERELVSTYPRAETWRVVVSLSLPRIGESPINGPSVLHGIRWVRVSTGSPAARTPRPGEAREAGAGEGGVTP